MNVETAFNSSMSSYHFKAQYGVDEGSSHPRNVPQDPTASSHIGIPNCLIVHPPVACYFCAVLQRYRLQGKTVLGYAGPYNHYIGAMSGYAGWIRPPAALHQHQLAVLLLVCIVEQKDQKATSKTWWRQQRPQQ